MNNYINLFKGYRKSLFILLVIPVIIISCIYINYGETIDLHLERNKTITKIYQLKTHYDIFKLDTEFSSMNPMPIIVMKLGYYSSIMYYILFFGWLLITAALTYLNLSFNKGSRSTMLLETFLLLVIFVIIVSPGLSIWLSILGFLIIAFLIAIILMYWFYAIRYKK